MLPGKSRTLHMTTSIWEFLLRFFRKDVGRIFQVIIKFFQINQKKLECFKWWRLSENFCTYFLGRTSAGKISILCLHPSVENDLILLWRTSAGWVKVSLARSPSGELGGGGSPPQCVDPLSYLVKLKWSEAKWSEVKRNQKVASNQLKIGHRVAHG